MEGMKRCIASFIYCQLLNAVSTGKWSENFWHYLRARVLKFWDPVILVQFGDVQMDLHLSHNLPLYYCKYKSYDRLLPELCSYLEMHEGDMTLIDVGANIGDTAALVDARSSGRILCIEGDEEFFPLLESNVKKLNKSRIAIAKSFCSDGIASDGNYVVNTSCGTSHLVKVDDIHNSVSLKSLDTILAEFSEFRNANILKIDTDGFEPRVLKGAQRYLSEAKPLVFFEFTPQGSPAELVSLSPEEDSFEILSSLGYERALFYNNFGTLCKEVKVSDAASIEDLISKIDLKDIFYYDILCCHKDKKIHNNLLDMLVSQKC
jgi:FkbM family methyltransferase